MHWAFVFKYAKRSGNCEQLLREAVEGMNSECCGTEVGSQITESSQSLESTKPSKGRRLLVALVFDAEARAFTTCRLLESVAA